MDPVEVVVALPTAVDATGIARRCVTDHAGGLSQAMIDDAMLLVSELVGDAVRDGRPRIVLRVRPHPPGIGIDVHDDGDTVPTLPDGSPDPTSPTGRGLLIVAALADSWGVTTSQPPPGKTVWFELGAYAAAG